MLVGQAAYVTMAYFQVAQAVELPAALYPFTNFSWVFSDNAMAIPAGVCLAQARSSGRADGLASVTR